MEIYQPSVKSAIQIDPMQMVRNGQSESKSQKQWRASTQNVSQHNWPCGQISGHSHLATSLTLVETDTMSKVSMKTVRGERWVISTILYLQLS